ncbi:MAG: metal ABC transporter permease [Chlamydiota bacterium]
MLTTHPYWGASFCQFFGILFARLGLLIQGKLSIAELSSDEVQLAVLILIALAATLVGTFLVLTKMTMLANALSHTILLGLALAFIIGKVDGQAPMLSLSTLMIAALVSALLTMLSVELLQRGAKLQRDASIGLVFTTFFALGILIVSLTARYSHLGVEAVMGNIDALHCSDIYLGAMVLAGNSALLLLLFKRWKIAAFDATLARSFGLSLFFLQAMLLLQTATTAVASFRAVGVFLFLALLVVPVTAARFLVHRLKAVMAVAAAIGVITSVLAVALGRHLLSVHQVSVSTAGLVALLLVVFLIFSLGVRLIGNQKKRLKKVATL